MDGAAVIAAITSCRRHVEASFRMTSLPARPAGFDHQREAIEAHLTVVFAALAVSRYPSLIKLVPHPRALGALGEPHRAHCCRRPATVVARYVETGWSGPLPAGSQNQ